MTTHSQALENIRDLVGPKGWIAAQAEMQPYLREERGLYRGVAAAVVRPGSTDEVAKVLAICIESEQPLV